MISSQHGCNSVAITWSWAVEVVAGGGHRGGVLGKRDSLITGPSAAQLNLLFSSKHARALAGPCMKWQQPAALRSTLLQNQVCGCQG